MQLTGTIKMIGQTQEVSQSVRKRELVVTTDEQYAQHILIEFHQDKCEVLNGYQVGQQVTVDLNLRGRSWTNPQGEEKYFNTIQGWRINAVGQPQHPQQFQGQQPVQQYQNPQGQPTYANNPQQQYQQFQQQPQQGFQQQGYPQQPNQEPQF